MSRVNTASELNPMCPVCQAQRCRTCDHNLTVCSDCGHIFQTDLKVSASYDAAYAHQYDSRPVAAMSELRWDFIQLFLHLAPGSRILDIGYGNGAFLKHAENRGMEIFGIDVHKENFGIPVVDLSTDLSFDLICFFDSLEHIPDFSDLFRLRSRHIAVSIPATPDFVLQSPRQWRHYKPGEHLHYFRPPSLDRLMQRWGRFANIGSGHPEDRIRGKLARNGVLFDNIYTGIYSRRSAVSDGVTLAGS